MFLSFFMWLSGYYDGMLLAALFIYCYHILVMFTVILILCDHIIGTYLIAIAYMSEVTNFTPALKDYVQPVLAVHDSGKFIMLCDLLCFLEKGIGRILILSCKAIIISSLDWNLSYIICFCCDLDNNQDMK